MAKKPRSPEYNSKLPRITYQYIENLGAEDYSKFSREKMLKLVEATRKKASIRVKQIEKANKFSPAYEKYLEAGGRLVKPNSKTSLSKLRQEFSRLQGFLSSRSSTVQGIRGIEREQDERIFGISSSGRPRYRMTAEQRKRFWSAYNEFINQNPVILANVQSGAVMQYLGRATFWRKRDFTQQDFNNLVNALDDII